MEIKANNDTTLCKTLKLSILTLKKELCVLKKTRVEEENDLNASFVKLNEAIDASAGIEN